MHDLHVKRRECKTFSRTRNPPPFFFSKQYIYKFNLLFSFNRALPLSNKMSSLQLSKGALKQVFSKEGHDSVQIPMILQITNIKAFDVLPSDLKKFRILVNDGVYSTHGLIDESCSEYIKNNNCQRYAIVQVNAFSILPH